MSRAINEEAPLEGIVAGTATIRHSVIPVSLLVVTVIRALPHMVKHGPRPEVIPLKSRAEYYQVALREEGEARAALRTAIQAQATAEEALRDAVDQLNLTRDGLFKACGL